MKRKLLFLAMLGTILLCSVGCATPVNQKDLEPSPPTSSPSLTSPAETKQTPSLSPTPPATDGVETLPTPVPPPTPELFWDFWMYFFPNGGKIESGHGCYIEHLHPGNPYPYEIPTPEKIGYSKEGYTFKHWNTKADGTGEVYEAGQIINSSLWKLYAIWEKNR